MTDGAAPPISSPAPQPQSADAEAPPATARPSRRTSAALALGAVGVVFGDIGTSPLYAMREALAHARHGGEGPGAVIGVVSLIIWTLVLIVTVKYVIVLMRADNRGEGGTLALMALAQRAVGRRTTTLFLLGAIGAALFFGDGLITPAISVLSAVEGVKAAPEIGRHLAPYALPIAAGILVALFLLQGVGTRRVAAYFRTHRRRLVPDAGGARCLAALGRLGHPLGAQSLLRRPLPDRERILGLRHPGQRLPGRDRRRGALHRHGPFRPQRRSAAPGFSWCSRAWR